MKSAYCRGLQKYFSLENFSLKETDVKIQCIKKKSKIKMRHLRGDLGPEGSTSQLLCSPLGGFCEECEEP